MTIVTGKVESVHAGSSEDLSKQERAAIDVELDGIVGDAHRSFERRAWSGDKQPKNTRRRNERQWSAVSLEELAEIASAMNLEAPLNAADLGANLCLSGIDGLSRLPKGTLLRFPSGAELVVEEFNPPCADMGRQIAEKYRTRDGKRPAFTAFSKAAKLKRGLVGVVEVPGSIRADDTVEVYVYSPPAWLSSFDRDRVLSAK